MDVTCPKCGGSVPRGGKTCPSCGVATASADPPTTRVALGGVVLVIVVSFALIGVVYLVPPEHLRIGDIQAVVRVAPEAEFGVGTSRLVFLGDAPVLVVRHTENEYDALQGNAPSDGCYLQWDEEARHVVSPCTYLVYDTRGNVLAGLTTEPLHRYRVFTRDQVVYVTNQNGDG